MGPSDLAQVLSGLPQEFNANVLVGIATSDDAAVYRISDDLAMVQSLDFFTPIVDSPYMFGAIAAANSLSDIYAMGATPALAMNIVAFPKGNPDVPMSVLAEILRGGSDAAKEAQISVAGGHTIYDEEPKYGMSVTGFVHPDKIWRNVGGKPGDVLLLTKPLGTGILTTALRNGAATPEIEDRVARSMAQLNKTAKELASTVDVHACTDVTGFGFLGHLREMLSDGTVGANVFVEDVPVLDDVRRLAEANHVPGGAKSNAATLRSVVEYASNVSEIDQLILSDPQTSGGLLFALSPDDAKLVQEQLHDRDVEAAIVGALTEEHAGKIRVA